MLGFSWHNQSMDDYFMPGIVEFSTVILEAAEKFAPMSQNERQRIHFAEYFCGLMLA